MLKLTRRMKMRPDTGLAPKPEPFAARKRFYKNVKIITNESNVLKTRTYSLAMDNRNLRSASGTMMEIPSYPLALAAAAEWDQQHPYINKASMPLFSIMNLCHDYDPTMKNKEGIIEEIIRYLRTDTLLYREFQNQDLADIQNEKWGPATKQLMDMLDIELGTTNTFSPPVVSQSAQDQVQLYLETFNMWDLIALERIVMTLKSSVLALLCAAREITAEEAVDLSLVELDFQTSRWGEVEWHHGVERQDLYAKTAAATMIVHHASESQESFELSPLERLKAVANEMEINAPFVQKFA